MNAFTIEMIRADARIDAGAAEYEFNLFIAEGPGVKAADILATMRDGERTKAFWVNALRKAKQARAAWLKSF